MNEHQITIDYEVAWSAGPGRTAYAVAGGAPDPFIDKRTDIFMGWACSCGAFGATKDGLGEHTSALLADGQGYGFTVDRRGE